jgi:hypothetical protein
MEEVVTTPAEAPVAPPPPAPDAHASELAEIRASLDRIERGPPVEIPALQDADSGREKERYSGIQDSARYLARRRREAAEADAQPSEPGIDLEITDRSNRPEIDIKVASAELADYRRRMAEQILENVDPATAAARASGLEVPQQQTEVQQPPEPPPTYTSDELVEQITRASADSALRAREQHAEDLAQLLMTVQGSPVPEALAAIRSPEDAAKLRAQNPQLAQELHDYIVRRTNMAQALQTELGKVQQQQQQAFQERFQAYAVEQDFLAGHLIEECRDDYPDQAGYKALVEASRDTLRDAGFTAAELQAAWNQGAMLSIRDARAQKIVADAARWRMAQQKARSAIQKPVPPVQRPGVRQPERTAAQLNVEQLSRDLDSSRSEQQQLRLAARLVSERRRARG